MCISKDHFIEDDWENLMNPLDAYLDHLESLRAKAIDAEDLNPRYIMFSAGGDDAPAQWQRPTRPRPRLQRRSLHCLFACRASRRRHHEAVAAT